MMFDEFLLEVSGYTILVFSELLLRLTSGHLGFNHYIERGSQGHL